eukprot:431823_1
MELKATETNNTYNEHIISQLFVFGYQNRNEIVSAMKTVTNSNDINSVIDYIEQNRQKSLYNSTKIDGPVFVWRDKNVQESTVTNIFNDYADVYLTRKTLDATNLIQKFQNQNRTVFVITNGGDQAEAFIKIVRHKFKIKTELVIFCNAVDYVKTWAIKYFKINVMKGSHNLRRWFDETLLTYQTSYNKLKNAKTSVSKKNNKPIFVWRDKNIKGSYNLAVFGKYKDIHSVITTEESVTLIKQFQKQNRIVYVITNGGDNAEQFIKTIRYQLKIKTELVIFCNAVDYVKKWAVNYDNITVIKGKSNLRNWVNKKLKQTETKSIQTVMIENKSNQDTEMKSKATNIDKKPTFIWRDKNITNSFNSKIFAKEDNVHYAATTSEAVQLIKKYNAKKQIMYIITNGGDNAQTFIDIVRNKLNINREIVIFCNAVDYVKTWAVKYYNINVIKGANNLREWVVSKTSSYVIEKEDLKLSFIEHMTFEQADKLKRNDYVDYQDDKGKFHFSEILKKSNSKLIVKYGETTTSCNYVLNTDQLAKAGSISTRKANRLKELRVGCYLDVFYLRWRCVQIKIMDSVSGQICVKYYDSRKSYERWFHLDNVSKVQKFGTKCNLDDILDNHFYKPYFDLDKHGNDFAAIHEKLKDCCAYIRNKIIPREKNKSRRTMIQYVCSMYNRFFVNFIATQNINKDILQITLTTSQQLLSPTNQTQVKSIKMKWHTINDFENKVNVSQTCNKLFDCGCIKRIEYLLELFQENVVDLHKYESDEIEDVDCINFILLYNECIYNDNYNVINIINDFNHIQQYHIQHMYKHSHLLPKCTNEICIMNKRSEYELKESNNEYFGYQGAEEIKLIKLFVKNHVYLSHRLCFTKRFHHNSINDYEEKQTGYSVEIACANKFVTEVYDNTKFYDDEELKSTDNKLPAFEFGERFYYAKYFREQKGEYFIERTRYDNLKEELLQNEIHPLTLTIFHSQLLTARDATLTDYCRKMNASNLGSWNKYYQLPVNSIISISQMLSILIYTNLTELQRKFKKFACRKLHKQDIIKDIAKRNAQIGIWYQLFYQTIYFFGSMTKKSETFYHGLSIKLLFTSFNPSFNCPISTTTQLLVAARFAANGVILELKPDIASNNWYLDVSMFSNFPSEHERLFAFANDLYIADIRFMENELEMRHTNKIHLNALRLMDYIFKSNTVYNPNVLKQNSQKLLIKYLNKYVNEKNSIGNIDTILDDIKMYNYQNLLTSLNNIIDEEQYDTESILNDIQEKKNSLIINYFEQHCTNSQLKLFNEYMKYHSIIIPKYLYELFCAMINDLKYKKNVIFMIKSQYDAVDVELKKRLLIFKDNKIITNKLNLPVSNIKLIQEFKWKINPSYFIKIKQLKTGEYLTGPKWSITLDENDELKIIFYPQFARSSRTWPDKCEIGVQIKDIPSNIGRAIQFSFSFLFKEINFSTSDKSLMLNKCHSYGIMGCSNKLIDKINALSVIMFVRYV